MSESRQRRIEQAWVAVAVVAAVIISVLSYLTERPSVSNSASSSQIDLLKGNLTNDWSVFGSLSASDVRFKQIDDGIVEIDVLANTPSWSDGSSGVSYTASPLSSGWYEFTGAFRTGTNAIEGIGAQLEIHSSRWRFVMKADSRSADGWNNIDVYFRPADSSPSAEVSCRFWADSSHRVGRVLFRNMRLVKLAGAPPLGIAQFDLQRKEEARLGKPGRRGNGSDASLGGVWITVLFLATIVGVCWRLFE